MTPQEKKQIENAFYSYPNNENENCNKMVECILTKYRFEREEKLIRMYYFEGKQIYNICRFFKFSKRNFYYSINNVLNASYMFAKDLKVI